MRTRIILSMLMVVGIVCLPAAATRGLGSFYKVVKLDGDANGVVVPPIAVEKMKTIRLTVKLENLPEALTVSRSYAHLFKQM